MIISVEKLKSYVNTSESDEVLLDKLTALEIMIRKYTNNNFQNRNKRFHTSIINGNFNSSSPYITAGDTVQISESTLNDGLYLFSADMKLLDEESCLVTKVEYPADVQMGVVNLLKWDIENRDKIGIQSETISRHSVTYFNMDGNNASLGYPKSLMGFLTPYMKARF